MDEIKNDNRTGEQKPGERTPMEKVIAMTADRISKLMEAWAGCRQRMDRDFEQFFRKRAEAAYRINLELAEFRCFLEQAKNFDEQKLINWLKCEIARIEARLLCGDLRLNTHVRMENIAYGISLRVMQRMRVFYITLLDILTEQQATVTIT